MTKITMKKFLAIFVMAFSCFFTGCTCDLLSPTTTLSAPEIKYYSDSNAISWKTVPNATMYNIYCDDKIIAVVHDVYEEDCLIYDLSSVINDKENHEIKVTASSDMKFVSDSVGSNIVSHVNNSVAEIYDLDEYEYRLNADVEFKLKGTEVSYVPVEGIDKYYLFAYTNSNGLKIIECVGQTISLKSTSLMLDGSDNIVALRLGYKEEDKYYFLSNIVYYNSVNYNGYTDNIYIFDGKINDHYIESLQELNSVVYNNFIARIEEYNIKFSAGMEELIKESFDGSTLKDKVDNAMYYSLTNMFETSENRADNTSGTFAIPLNGEREYNIKIDYGDGVCNTNILPTMLREQADATPYYEMVDYTMRSVKYGIDYDNFPSDKRVLHTLINNSEQLYWAVENKVTPVFENTQDGNNRAYEIYKEAKSVLNQIISDDMTDYEKALSIFDWICLNTVYDHSMYEGNITSHPCYYLEGVFTTGYAVCDGYSKAYSLMCNMLGIECIRITGEAVTDSGRGGHAWNKILVDTDNNLENGKECYLIDITWTEIQENSSEYLSKSYFMISDNEVESTHFPFEQRVEFKLYPSTKTYNYYGSTKFNYNDVSYDLIISNDDDILNLFGYLLESGIRHYEVIVDYDYMVQVYESATSKKYNSRTDYKVKKFMNGTVQSVVYYNELLDNLIDKMSKIKNSDDMPLTCQSFDVIRSIDLVKYGEGKEGLVLLFEQSLLIDDNNDAENIVNYFNETKNYNRYLLYIDHKILSPKSSDYFKSVESLLGELFDPLLDGKDNITFVFQVVDASVKYTALNYACVLIFDVVEKVVEVS